MCFTVFDLKVYVVEVESEGREVAEGLTKYMDILPW
jgi:hypothetical protein